HPLRKYTGRGVSVGLHLVRVFPQGMTRDVEAERFLLVLEFEPFRPRIGGIEGMFLFPARRQHAEEAALADFLFSLLALAPIHCAIDVCIHQRAILADAVERSGLDETL